MPDVNKYGLVQRGTDKSLRISRMNCPLSKVSISMLEGWICLRAGNRSAVGGDGGVWGVVLLGLFSKLSALTRLTFICGREGLEPL
jgi:hypothetical protein